MVWLLTTDKQQKGYIYASMLKTNSLLREKIISDESDCHSDTAAPVNVPVLNFWANNANIANGQSSVYRLFILCHAQLKFYNQ